MWCSINSSRGYHKKKVVQKIYPKRVENHHDNNETSALWFAATTTHEVEKSNVIVWTMLLVKTNDLPDDPSIYTERYWQPPIRFQVLRWDHVKLAIVAVKTRPPLGISIIEAYLRRQFQCRGGDRLRPRTILIAIFMVLEYPTPSWPQQSATVPCDASLSPPSRSDFPTTKSVVPRSGTTPQPRCRFRHHHKHHHGRRCFYRVPFQPYRMRDSSSCACVLPS